MPGRNKCVNRKLLRKIMELQFAVLETILYLDTHPDDEVVLNLHNRFAEELQRLLDEYQRKYGQLSPYYANARYPWQWINEPWPWQINY